MKKLLIGLALLTSMSSFAFTPDISIQKTLQYSFDNAEVKVSKRVQHAKYDSLQGFKLVIEEITEEGERIKVQSDLLYKKFAKVNLDSIANALCSRLGYMKSEYNRSGGTVYINVDQVIPIIDEEFTLSLVSGQSLLGENEYCGLSAFGNVKCLKSLDLVHCSKEINEVQKVSPSVVINN
jgi:hypothetical protein